MFWRIHKAVFDGRENEVLDVLSSFGDDVQLVFGGTDKIAPYPMYDEYNLPPIYGTCITTIQDARNAPFYITHFFNNDDYKASNWMSTVPSHIPLLNEYSMFVPAGLLRRDGVMFRIKRDLSRNNKVFIRPDTGNKVFAGQLFDIGNDLEYSLTTIERHTNNNTMLLVALPANVDDIEWRFWVINKTVVAFTPYSWEGSIPLHDPSEKIMALANKVATDWGAFDNYVLDIVTLHGDCYVNEINSISTSGTYSVDFNLLLPAIRSLVIDTEDELNG